MPKLNQHLYQRIFIYLHQQRSSEQQYNLIEIKETILSGIYQIEQAMSQIILLVLSLLFLFQIHTTFGLILSTWCLLITCHNLTIFPKHIQLNYLKNLRHQALMRTLTDSLNNHLAVRVYQQLNHELNFCQQYFNHLKQADRHVRRKQLATKIKQDIGSFATQMILILLVYYHYQHLHISIGDVASIIQLSLTGMRTWTLLSDQSLNLLNLMQKTITILQQISPKPKPAASTETPLDLQDKQTTALIGRSGSGKSQSIYQLIEKLSQPISLLPQQLDLFQRSVADNIRYSHPDANLEDIIHAAKLAHCHEFIMTQPAGYDTLINHKEQQFSHGERQRILLARAILKPNCLLILDEPTSALDSECVQSLKAHLPMICHNRTALIITHQLDFIDKIQHILVMQSGQIIAKGTHLQLLKQCAEYQELTQI